MKRIRFFSLLLLVVAVALLGFASASALGGYTLDWWTVDGGGGALSGGGYALGGTIGQPEPGPVLTGGSFALYSGFWVGGGAAPPTCSAPLLDVDIVGPSSGYTGSQYSFIAQSNPVTPTLPLTFTWSTDGLISGQGAATAVYSWAITGSHAISLTATNCGGERTGSHQIDIASEYLVYLPLVVK